jgi:hypothetical protein
MKRLLLTGIRKIRSLLDLAEAKVKESDIHVLSEQPADKPYIEPKSPQSIPQQTQLAIPGLELPEQSTYEDRKPMNDLLRKWGRASGCTYKELKAKIRAHSGVSRIDLMTKIQVKEACAWIEMRIREAKPDNERQGSLL